jgi:quinol monooxygenase YgiN
MSTSRSCLINFKGFLARDERETPLQVARSLGWCGFDVLSDRTDPNHVVLVEIYRDEAAAAAHKDTGTISAGATSSRR